MTPTHAPPAIIPTRRFITTTVAGAAACAALGPVARAAVPSLPTAPVALSGGTAPGTDATTRFSRFGTVSINPSGQVLFDAMLNGPNVTEFNDSAAFTGWALRDGTGGLGVLAREGQTAPGGDPSVVYGNILGTGALNPEGQGIFITELRPPGGGAGYGTIAGSPGDLRLVHRHALNEAIIGQTLLNSGPRSVLWPHGANHLIYWDGSAETEVPTPGNYFQPTINRGGRIAFTAYSDDQPDGLYAGPPGDFRPVVVVGDASPGMPAGHTFAVVLDASQNNAGQLAFLAAAQSVEPESYGWGLWAGQPDDLRLLARDGQPAPGLPDGYRFERLLWDIDSPTTPPISAAGHVPFWASYEDQSGADRGTGAWIARPGEAARLLARRGDAVPVTPPGDEEAEVVLESFHHDGLWANADGHAVIRAITAGDSGLRETLLAAGADGGFWLIAREGSPFEVAPGDVRFVSDILIRAGSGGEDGRMSPFNDADQLVYRLTFTDGTSGLFLTTVPEPGALTLTMAVGGALLVRLPRRRAARA